jgi:hypothetical protein
MYMNKTPEIVRVNPDPSMMGGMVAGENHIIYLFVFMRLVLIFESGFFR